LSPFGLLPRVLYCVVLLAYLIKTGFRICPINDDLLPIGPWLPPLPGHSAVS